MTAPEMQQDESPPASTPPQPPPPEPPPQPVEAAPPAPPRPGAVVEWFTLRRAEAEARAQVERHGEAQQACIERALAAVELADRAIEPVEPLHHGSGVPLAISLYREAAYWALLAQKRQAQAPDLAAALRVIDRDVVELCAGGPERLELLRRGLVTSDFVQIAALPPEEQLAIAQQARLFVGALVDRFQGPQKRLELLRVSRWVRIVGTSLAVIGLVVAVVVGVQRMRLGPDLAAGKPWRASSSYSGFNPKDPGDSKIFFHTNEEENPWVEIDLGAPTTVGSVEVRNRGDNLQGRALPTVIELSLDRSMWNEVARKGTSYTTWTASFSPRQARYVRVKAASRTYLHLEKVSVRAK